MSTMNAAANLIYFSNQCVAAASICQPFHWLPLTQCEKFKLLTTTNPKHCPQINHQPQPIAQSVFSAPPKTSFSLILSSFPPCSPPGLLQNLFQPIIPYMLIFSISSSSTASTLCTTPPFRL